MATLHISEAELARDVQSVLDQVQAGSEIVIERDAIPVAVIRTPEPPRRKLSQILALIPKHSNAVMDESFASDVDSSIQGHRDPLDSPAWD